MQNLEIKYKKLKNKKIPRWEEKIKKTNILNNQDIKYQMSCEIEDLRAYIRELKAFITRNLINANKSKTQTTE